ncbi:hypothetical protein JCM8208_005916 [Rhodotorula glutinis]
MARDPGTPVGRLLAAEGLAVRSPRRVRQRSLGDKLMNWPSNALMSIETSVQLLSFDSAGYPAALAFHLVHFLVRLSAFVPSFSSITSTFYSSASTASRSPPQGRRSRAGWAAGPPLAPSDGSGPISCCFGCSYCGVGLNWQALCSSQDSFVARLLDQCDTLQTEVDQLEAAPPAGVHQEQGPGEEELRRGEQERRRMALEEQVGSFTSVNEELAREAEDRRQLIQARTSRLAAASTSGSARTAARPAPEADHEGPPFILCLINGSSVLFNHGPISQGHTGGKDVATRLLWEIDKDMSAHDFALAGGDKPGRPVVLALFLYNKVELLRELLRHKIISSASTWDDFCAAFASEANNQCIDIAGDADAAIATLLLGLGYAPNLKHIYIVGAQLHRLYEACPALLPSDVALFVEVGPKIVLVNASETEDERDLLSTSGWRVTTFPRFFGTSLDSRPRSPSPDNSPSPSSSKSSPTAYAGAVKAPAKKLTALPQRDVGKTPKFELPMSERPVAAPEGADMASFYASLTTPRSRHHFNPTARLLDQNPQICCWFYFSVDGCTLPSCHRSHSYDLTSRGRRVLKKEIATINCKELMRTGKCTWRAENGVSCMFNHHFRGAPPTAKDD